MTVNGKATDIRFDGVFESKVKLTGVTTDIRIEAEDEHGHKANYNYVVIEEQSSGKDTIPPEIHIGKRRKRAMKIKEAEPIPQIINGYVVDASGVKSVSVDGEIAELDKYGNFSICIFLAIDKKKVVITAEDKYGNKTTKKHSVQEGTAIQKSDTRGPDIEVVESDSTTILEGQAATPSDIALLCVNGVPTQLDADGKFSHDLLLKKGENLLRVAAYDDSGNKTVKLITRTGLEAANEIIPKGKYYSLLVGNNDYIYLNKLKTAVNDAREVGKILKNDFNFETITLVDAARSDILRKLNKFRKTLKKDDKLIIYYAGHGFYDQKTDAAYWLPVDAEKEDSTNWILSSSITKSIKGIDAKSVLVVSDSCYSGTLSGRRYRDASVSLDREDNRKIYLKKMLASPCRMLMGSGGNEPVVDSGGAEGHSIFASAFMESLQNVNEDVFTIQDIFNPISNRVGGAADQVPVLDIIRNSGHGSGVFVFFRNKNIIPE